MDQFLQGRKERICVFIHCLFFSLFSLLFCVYYFVKINTLLQTFFSCYFYTSITQASFYQKNTKVPAQATMAVKHFDRNKPSVGSYGRTAPLGKGGWEQAAERKKDKIIFYRISCLKTLCFVLTFMVFITPDYGAIALAKVHVLSKFVLSVDFHFLLW